MEMELNMSDFASILAQDIDLGITLGSLNFEPQKSLKEEALEEPVKPQVPSQPFVVDGETGECLVYQNNDDVEKPADKNDIDDILTMLNGDIDEKNKYFNDEIDIGDLQSLIESKPEEATTQELFNDMVELSGVEFSGDGVKDNPIKADLINMDQNEMQWNYSYPTPPSDRLAQYIQQPQQPNPLRQESQMLMDFDGYNDMSLMQPNDAPQGGAEQQVVSYDLGGPGELFFNPNAEIRDVMDELQSLNSLTFSQEETAFNNPLNAPFVPPPLAMVGNQSNPSTTQTSYVNIMETIDSDSGISVDSETGFGTLNSMQLTQAVHKQELENLEKKNTKNSTKQEKKENKRESRDLKKAIMLKIPFTMDQIIYSSVEQYNAMLAQTKLTAEQQSLVRDIRRRGKNKVAAQNCRKRKIDTISNLEEGVDQLVQKKEKLLAQKASLGMKQDKLKENYAALYKQIFQSLRDENGNQYDPRHYRLEQVDGAIILAPVLGLANAKRESNVTQVKKPVTFFDLTKVKIEKPE